MLPAVLRTIRMGITAAFIIIEGASSGGVKLVSAGQISAAVPLIQREADSFLTVCLSDCLSVT